MEQCGFFDAKLDGDVYDREYLSASFARYFASFIGNGVFPKPSSGLQVLASSPENMNVNIQLGQGWINGYWYENTDILTKAIDVADGLLNRIDLIVLRWGSTERAMRCQVIKGTPAVSPIAPTPSRSADYYDLVLAQVSVPKGVTTIKQSYITDKRLDATVCGLVTGTVTSLDTTTLGNQLQTYINEYMVKFNNDYANFVINLNELKALAQVKYDEFLEFINNLKADSVQDYNAFVAWLNQYKVDSRNSFDTWFNGVKDLINTNTDVQALLTGIQTIKNIIPDTEFVTINHGLDNYPNAQLIFIENGYGTVGYGQVPYGGSGSESYEAKVKIKYLNRSSLKIFLPVSDIISGATVEKVNDYEYMIYKRGSNKSIYVKLGIIDNITYVVDDETGDYLVDENNAYLVD